MPTTETYGVITRGASHKCETREEAEWLANSLFRTADWVDVDRYWMEDDPEEGLVHQSETILELRR